MRPKIELKRGVFASLRGGTLAVLKSYSAVTAENSGAQTVYQDPKKTPAPSVKILMADPMGILALEKIMDEVLAFLEEGKGKYSPRDGAFEAQEPTFGTPVENPTPGHQKIRQDLHGVIVYMQGLSRVFDKAYEGKLLLPLKRTSEIYKEGNMNRSKMLLNEHYKSLIQMSDGKMTLSKLTTVARTSDARGRQHVRDKIAPTLEAHGLWTIEPVDDQRTNFLAGPLLVMFAERVIAKIKPLDGGAS